MKKAAAIALCLLIAVLVFAGCGKIEPFENSNEAFSSLPAYTDGEIISADFANACSIKIKDSNYENFRKYIETLKDAGFEYLPFGSAPENYNLSNGSALWRCKNDKICLQIMFNENNTSGYEIFGCNIQIYGYDEIPDSWAESMNKNEK